MTEPTFTPEQIASVAHAANRALQAIAGDSNPSPSWDEAPQDQRDSAVAGIESALSGATPEEQHDAWAAYKRAGGWVYGEVKDAAAKTHPCLVPYSDLPPEQRVKDGVYIAIVRAMADDECKDEMEAALAHIMAGAPLPDGPVREHLTGLIIAAAKAHRAGVDVATMAMVVHLGVAAADLDKRDKEAAR